MELKVVATKEELETLKRELKDLRVEYKKLKKVYGLLDRNTFTCLQAICRIETFLKFSKNKKNKHGQGYAKNSYTAYKIENADKKFLWKFRARGIDDAFYLASQNFGNDVLVCRSNMFKGKGK